MMAFLFLNGFRLLIDFFFSPPVIFKIQVDLAHLFPFTLLLFF